MDVMQAIRERRSVRRYKPDPVSEEALKAVLEAARWAPSWANTQCWRLVVVRAPEVKAKLAGVLAFTASGRENRAALAIRNAPIVIVACAERRRSGYHRGSPLTDKGDWFMFDVALAMQNLALAAHAIALGTVHVGLFDAKKVEQILDVPEDISVVEMTPLGYPDEEPRVTPRRGLEEFVFYDRYVTIDPKTLAAKIGIKEETLRARLRRKYPRPPERKGKGWKISPDMARGIEENR